ncbi:MAG TPA: BatA domain-containing protein [Pirellulales bacterium]|nr:BatA domain-containing protein [Pirellulales bacterium]
MGLLAPLYLAGLAALSLPLVFHLIRRTPRGRQAFSSLMFLTPSPPRLTRRSRIDQWLLLLLRAAALAILVLAFARPFLRESALLPLDDLPSRRVAILVDTSASMRRGDLWQQAVAKVEEIVSDLGPRDDMALVAFADRPQTIVDFAKDASEPTAGKADLVRKRLKTLAPGWSSTDLGAALVSAANDLDAADDGRQAAAEPYLALVTDLQRGARTEALQGYDWPKKAPLEVHKLSPAKTTNATVQLLVDGERPDAEASRVRVTNAADSAGEEFFIHWTNDARSSTEDTLVPAYVPAGQSRVFRLQRADDKLAADRVVLRGDDAEFDNAYYVVPQREEHVPLAYVGPDAADDRRGPRYYLELALAGDPLRKVELREQAADQPLPTSAEERPKLVVVTQAISPALAESLSAYLAAGGMLLAAPPDRAAAESLAAIFDDVEFDARNDSAKGADAGQYLMLGEIDFSHPLFAVFANPRYGDFTKIHFWRRRSAKLKQPATTKVLAKFDDGRPALLEHKTGAGRALLLTSGWRPDDSQLALSSKFVPLVQGILEQACGGRFNASSIEVGQAALLPAVAAGQSLVVEKPDGSRASLSAGAEAFGDTDQPGLYRVLSGDEEYRFAVNLLGAESNTAPLDLEQLEQLGVPLGQNLSRATRAEQARQQRDIELESLQKVWRWLIVAALGALIFETWLAGRTARQIRQTTEAFA